MTQPSTLVATPTAATTAADGWGYGDDVVPELVERVRALVPLLQAEAPAAEAQRNPTQVVVDALDELGLFRMLLPKRWGGLGLSTTGLARVNAEIAKGDPSVAWVVQIINGATWIASTTPDAVQDELFGDGPVRVCSAGAPTGTATPVDGGYLVTGTWPYSSGSHQAAWAQLGVFVIGTDGSRTPGGNVYVPLSDLEIKDTWHIVGMQGTGSDSLVAVDVLVPPSRFVGPEVEDGRDPASRHAEAPSDHWTDVTAVRVAGLGQLLGAADAMLAHVSAAAVTKPIATTIYAHQSDSQVYVREIGEIAAKLQTVRLLADHQTGVVDAAGLARTELTTAQRAELKSLGSVAIELLQETIDKLMFLAGSSAFSHENPLSRYWRDVHVGLRHILNLPHLGYEVYGKSLLGVEPGTIRGDSF